MAVVGLALLIVSLVVVQGVSIQTQPIKKTVEDTTKTLDNTAGTLDESSTYLKTMNGNLVDAKVTLTTSLDESMTLLEGLSSDLDNSKKLIVKVMGDSSQLLEQTSANLKQIQDAVADIGDNSVQLLGRVNANLDKTQAGVDTVTANVKYTRSNIKKWLESYKVQITAEGLDQTANLLKKYGLPAYAQGIEGIANYLETTDGAIDLWPLNLTSGDFNAVADGLEAVGLDATWFRQWANYLESKNAVIALSTSDVMAQFTPVVKNLKRASQNLAETASLLKSSQKDLKKVRENAVEGISQARKHLETAQTDLESAQEIVVGMLSNVDSYLSAATANIKSLKGTSVTSISDTRKFLGTAQADLSGLAENLRSVSKDIETADISGQINSTVDWLNGIISNLKLYMVISSIMFMLAGAGIVLTGFYFGRGQSS